MESLFLRDKASVVEDALTAALGDLLTDLGDVGIVGRLIAAARPADRDGRPLLRPVMETESCDGFWVDLWPRLEALGGAPDMVVWPTRGGLPGGGCRFRDQVPGGKVRRGFGARPGLRDQLARYAVGIADALGDPVDRVLWSELDDLDRALIS